ncbi:MAG: Arabinose import ATP-binding protein AraG [Planctomycetes bacterium ADurb.Bin126]|nr:MAG: Arabinose import ATP-binding protein AraG [Planctomycetes bacterium ADurb.Bin126]HOD84540.1 L-arabinose ABC transporter ATP-binding protein AraG [Phycisphaerae bacterium]HQL74624.1 L-arabinose ABC transporter ATP-binding protein AraG [Phycisphaerae bacterium]
MASGQPYLEFDAISKRFPGVQALDQVSFGVSAGSVHALVGENGAGKSTLLKVLSGVYAPDQGQVRLAGQVRSFRSTADAIAAGVAVIYQELHLVGEMSVAENLLLGNLPNRLGIVDRKRLRRLAQEELNFLEEDIDVDAKLSRLPIAQRQMVEIAKALMRDASVIAFDEPTSSLSDREVRKLFAVIRQLRDRGRAIIYVSHRMDEIFQVCDRVTVLRDGRHVVTFDEMGALDRDVLVKNMVGRELRDIYNYRPRDLGGPALEVRELEGPGLAAPVSLSLAEGEIVALFGLVGAGRSELLKLVYGDQAARGGTLLVRGRPVRVRHPADAVRAGVMLCPEDRKKEGIVPIRSVADNINLSARRHFSFLRFVISPRAERANAQAMVDKLSIRTPSLGQLVMNLSGGNQQKTILGRWLSENVKVLLLDEPTRGIDVGAKSEIYNIIFELARQGIGILLVSSELPEVLGLADRVLVMRQGRLVAEVPRGQANEEDLLRLALPESDPAAHRSLSS